MDTFQTENLTISYDDKIIVDNLNITVPVGKITALVGANGSGKSTILKTLARLLQPKNGQVLLDGKSIHTYSTKNVAKKLAILPQNPIAPDGLTVSELVAYGRYPHQKSFSSHSKEDFNIIHWAIDATGLSAFAESPVDELSGGQRQRAWIALALAQKTPILLLDEPTTFLDMGHQLDVLKLIRKLNEEQQRTIIMVVHDLNHATRFADHIICIKKGEVHTEGNPLEVLTEKVLKDVFQIEATILIEPKTGVPVCIPTDSITEETP
ncbi:ABC transporter ATP-binding protein [Solibacillus sp. R5-41]|uniref:ABC transporter ATP-binding protein n=1 Tax=Solibacillus sp. R5-41 TaxID=2048654 RepID=UPI00352C2A95